MKNEKFNNPIHSMTSLIQWPHSSNDWFTNALIHSMTPFAQWLIHQCQCPIHSMTHSANDSFTNAPFTQWPIHQWLIHQCPHSFNDPIQAITILLWHISAQNGARNSLFFLILSIWTWEIILDRFQTAQTSSS